MRTNHLVIIALTIAPRLVLLTLWLATPLVSLAFKSWLWPLAGFVFLPYTTMAYVLVWNPGQGVAGAAWLLVLGGLLFDLAIYALSAWVNRMEGQSADGPVG
jgi:hypothetical protein